MTFRGFWANGALRFLRLDASSFPNEPDLRPIGVAWKQNGILMSFEHLGLSDPLLDAVREVGYEEPTPIQRQAIPTILQGRDLIGIAQTGTGKTAAFVLPMIDILSSGRARARMPRSLILEPTRELAAQVAENFERYGKNHKLSMALLIGGVSFADQEAKLSRGVDVLIATPGRLLDHFERGKLLLTGVQILVVDECDRMLDMGFIPDVERICSLMPQRHQTLFFSATLSPEIKRLTDRFLDDPKLIEVAPPSSTAETVEQSVLVVAERDKTKALRRLLETEEVDNAIVFCNRKVDVRTVYLSLKRARFPVGQLHGDMSQPDRMATLQAFRDGEIKILVASDVAARGLDISSVSHVFNFDVPQNSEDYVHRIGRTGRAGRHGTAITLATPADARYVAQIEQLIGKRLAERTLDGLPARTLAREEGEQDEGAGERTHRTRARGTRGRREAPARRSWREETPTPHAARQETGEVVAASRDGNGQETTSSQDGEGERPRRRRRRGGRRRRERRSEGATASETQASRTSPSQEEEGREMQGEGQNRPRATRSRSHRGGRARREQGGERSRSGGEEKAARPAKLGEDSPIPAFLQRPARPKRRPPKAD